MTITQHKFQGLFLIQIERFLQNQFNEMRAEQNLDPVVHREYISY